MVINRAEIVQELEVDFNKRLFAIIFNPEYSEGIKEKDNEYFQHFIDNVIAKENIRDCVILLSGFGGNLKEAILCSQMLRESIKKYSCFIPSVACSAISYFILQGDRLLIGEESKITQIDPIFEYDGEDLRAIKHLNDENPKIKTIAHRMYNPVLENLRRVIRTSPNVFDKEIVKESQKGMKYLGKIVDFWMGKNHHKSGITCSDLDKVKVNYGIVSNQTIEKAKLLVRECLRESRNENRRLVIQTNGAGEKSYQGGFFHP